MRIDTYRVGNAWVVAQNEQWVPGLYESEQAARMACALTSPELEALAHVWSVEGENRPATKDEVRCLIEQVSAVSSLRVTADPQQPA